MSTIRVTILAAAAVAFGACSDGPTPPPQPPIGSDLVLSEPVAMSGVSPVSIAWMAGRAGSSGGTVVFTSLAPGTASQGSTAMIVNVTTGLTVQVGLSSGGLDPVPVPASVGDSISVTVSAPAGPLEFASTVPASQRPTVVRTIPAANTTGVPRNRAIVVVFSEPVAPSTVGSATITLLRSGTAVAGTVAFLDSSHVTVVLTPTALLEPDTRYRLEVSGSVTDLDGRPLDAAVSVEFTTGQRLLGPVAAVAVYPASITVPSGRLVQFTALLTDAAGDTLIGEPLTWASGDDAVAILSDIGVNAGIVVRGAAAGSATITATSGTVSGAGLVTVIGELPQLAFTALSVGYDHTCGVTTAGLIYCWGANNDGQLGNDGTTRSPYPTAVAGGLTAVSVGAGLLRSCALTGAGSASCWGDSGVTNIISWDTRSLVPVLVPGSTVFATMVVGGSHACGLTAAGEAWCWGSNSWGQLGDPTTSGTNMPRAVAGGLTFIALAAGGGHTCGIAADSTAWCWGYNALGGLGTGTTAATMVPVPVQGGLHFAVLAAGYGHSCAVTAAGAPYCWGANGRGQLGATSAEICPGQADAVATDACSLSPLLVSGISAVRSVGAGYSHSCALTTTGAAYCWGENTYAQLGTGTRASSPTPVAVSGNLTFASLSSAYYHSCGVAAGGIAYCWGNGVHGELGDGATEDRKTPVRVAGQQ